MPGTQNAAYVTNTSEADAIYDEIDTKDGPQVARNVAYGTSSCQEVSMKENAQYDTVPNRGLMSENAGYYGTSTFVSKTNGDGQVNDNMD